MQGVLRADRPPGTDRIDRLFRDCPGAKSVSVNPVRMPAEAGFRMHKRGLVCVYEKERISVFLGVYEIIMKEGGKE